MLMDFQSRSTKNGIKCHLMLKKIQRRFLKKCSETKNLSVLLSVRKSVICFAFHVQTQNIKSQKSEYWTTICVSVNDSSKKHGFQTISPTPWSLTILPEISVYFLPFVTFRDSSFKYMHAILYTN